MFQIVVVLLFALFAAKAIIDDIKINKLKEDVDAEEAKSTYYIQLVRDEFKALGEKIAEADEDIYADIIDIEKSLSDINKGKMLESALSTVATLKDIEVTHIIKALIKKVYGEEGLPQDVKDTISKEQGVLMDRLITNTTCQFNNFKTNKPYPDHAGEHQQPQKDTKIIDLPKVEV